MKSFIKNKLHKNDAASEAQPAPQVQPPSQQDVFQYRYHFGTNVGSIFVLEKWLFNKMFDGSAKGGSELDAVTASLRERGLDATKQKWADHWANALSDSDIDFLRDTAKCNTVRLPIGYFTLGPNFCGGTPFQGEPSQVYEQGWNAVLNMCTRLAQAGMGVLIDLHAVPGGCNGNDHSGTTSGKADHWNSKSNRQLSKSCLTFITNELAQGKIPNATGLQFCNEAEHNAPHMYDWYEDVTAAIHGVVPTLPVYVSDAWDLKTALKWSSKMNSAKNLGRTSPIVVDTHKYYTFSDSDRNQGPQQIIGRIPGALQPAKELGGSVVDRGAAQCYVGEWSCVLDGKTWSKVQPEEKGGLERQFGQAQCQSWYEASGGHAFWTAKMQWMDGGGWGFVQQIKSGNIAAPDYMGVSFEEANSRIEKANSEKENLKQQGVQGHVGYWDKQSPGKQFEHWRFEQGWDLGFDDAVAFAGMRARWQGRMGRAGLDKIGMLDIWIWKRMNETGTKGSFAWEWEQGYRQGIRAAQSVLGI